MDWGSYFAGFGTCAAVVISIPITIAIRNYRDGKEEQRDNFRFGTRCVDNASINLARTLYGVRGNDYDYLSKEQRREFRERTADNEEYWRSMKLEELPRNLRPLLADRQRAVRELLDVVLYLEKNDND